MTKRRHVLPVILLISTIACGGSGSSPTAPGSTSGAATISGSVLSGSSFAMTAAGTGYAMPGLVVTVAGTSISSGLDAAGRFSLKDVPPGNLQLQFSGPVSGTVPVNDVKPAESISLVVAVSSGSVTLESAARTGAGTEEIEGRIESLPPTMPADSLTVAGRTVTTNASTQIRHGSASIDFDDLEIGYRVHVKGTPSGSSVLASSIEIQNTITTIPVNVNGVVSDLTGTEDAFEFKVGSRLIKGDEDTEFFGNGNADSFDDLENGVRVEVKGLQRDGYVYADRLHISDGDDDDAEQDESASIHGELMSIGGAAPALQLLVGTTTVRTDASTEVRRRGDVQTLAELKVGMDVHVVGTRQADGSLDARMIQIVDDETGGEFEIQGSAGGVSGSCPTLTFGVNGYSIRTNAATSYDGITCPTLKSGTKVTVKGSVQGDGSVLATLVKK